MSIWENRVWTVCDRPCEIQTKKYELLCTCGDLKFQTLTVQESLNVVDAKRLQTT